MKSAALVTIQVSSVISEVFQLHFNLNTHTHTHTHTHGLVLHTSVASVICLLIYIQSEVMKFGLHICYIQAYLLL